ncbi:hypothetical protein Q0M94_14475 [Deinococcus radiomollis]|uniref:hypothetical protein n=1 Tax=Deinococcus radiomollis TaxID=468916 RepID=UPI0038914C33
MQYVFISCKCGVFFTPTYEVSESLQALSFGPAFVQQFGEFVTRSRWTDALKRSLLDNKELLGAVAAVVSTISDVIFGASAIFTAVTANKLIARQTELIEADQLPVVTIKVNEIYIPNEYFGKLVQRAEIYNQGAPIKSYSINVSHRVVIFFLKKDVKGVSLTSEGAIFNLENFSNNVDVPMGNSSLLSTIDTSSGIKKYFLWRKNF